MRDMTAAGWTSTAGSAAARAWGGTLPANFTCCSCGMFAHAGVRHCDAVLLGAPQAGEERALLRQHWHDHDPRVQGCHGPHRPANRWAGTRQCIGLGCLRHFPACLCCMCYSCSAVSCRQRAPPWWIGWTSGWEAAAQVSTSRAPHLAPCLSQQ